MLECQAQPAVCIVDSLLPGYGFFFGTHPLTAIAALTAQLTAILAPLHPLLVYVDSDIAVALNRAVAQLRLENTNYRVIFEPQATRGIKGLTLLYRGQQYQFDKIN